MSNIILLLFNFCHSKTKDNLSSINSTSQIILKDSVIKDTIQSLNKYKPVRKVSSLDLSSFIPVPDSYKGFWANVNYIEFLRKSKSTLAASMIDHANFYLISDDKTIMYLNIHDGGAPNALLLQSDGKGYIADRDTFQIYNDVQFKDDSLLIESNKYIKYNRLEELINLELFSGIYKLNNKQIEFKTNGDIIGLDGISKYYPYFDYYDAGMNLDLIQLTFIEENRFKNYIYEFQENNLIFYKVDCENFDEANSYCIEIRKGKEFLRLNKIK
ncbi:MAG: hypothetical protein MUE33_09410 [Cytophagaceae bacterium]|nr:hypothetical protein [Cytophagaceae bacterium]